MARSVMPFNFLEEADTELLAALKTEAGSSLTVPPRD